MTTSVFICLMLAFISLILSLFGHAKDRHELQKQADQLRAELEQMKTELSIAQGEARAALLAINQLNSKK